MCYLFCSMHVFVVENCPTVLINKINHLQNNACHFQYIGRLSVLIGVQKYISADVCVVYFTAFLIDNITAYCVYTGYKNNFSCYKIHLKIATFICNYITP